MKIIINADDLGLSRLVNDEIFSLIANGRITSSTIMANAPATEDALARLSEFPRASYGVHMNCTQFAPLTRDEALKPLLADNGEFKKDWKAARYSGAVRRAIYKEWCAQVEKIMDAGVRISHIDSHHHAHTEPALFFALKAVQRRFNIRRVRITRNIFDCGEKLPKGLPTRKRLWNFMLRNYIQTTTTDYFTSLDTFHANLREGRIFSGTVEVMVHPGHPRFAEETKLADTNWMSCIGANWSLLTYHELEKRTDSKSKTSRRDQCGGLGQVAE
jgi:chitin disaccharide deacetylase